MLTISSPLSPPAFASFIIQLSNSQGVDQLRDESATRYGFSVSGSGVRAAHANLKNLETRVLVNGEPTMTLAGLIVASAIGQGQLVKVEAPVYSRGAPSDLETVSVTGIITNLVWTASNSPLGQRLDFILQRCHRLHVRSGGIVTTSTDPSAEPPEPEPPGGV